jgi:hypothetical protein
MADDAADLIFIDPPYNVDYEGYTEDHLKIQGDRMTDEQFSRFLEAGFRSCRGVAKPGAYRKLAQLPDGRHSSPDPAKLRRLQAQANLTLKKI